MGLLTGVELEPFMADYSAKQERKRRAEEKKAKEKKATAAHKTTRKVRAPKTRGR